MSPGGWVCTLTLFHQVSGNYGGGILPPGSPEVPPPEARKEDHGDFEFDESGQTIMRKSENYICIVPYLHAIDLNIKIKELKC